VRSPLQIRFLTETQSYAGPELSPHWILGRTRIEGSALIAFTGSCHVKTEHLVDWEDRLGQDFIRAESMLHFLGEFFGVSLESGVWLQRTLVGIAKDVLTDLLPGWSGRLVRDGDDLFIDQIIDQKKLSVSVVAPSIASVLLHFAINIDSAGAPVAAIGLKDLLNGQKESAFIPIFATKVLERIQAEWASVSRACVKIRPVV